MKDKRRDNTGRARLVLLLVALALILAAGCGGDDDDGAAREGSLQITTDIDFSEDPYRGTFEVSEGSGGLGCSSGTFVDTGAGADRIRKTFTCEEGEREGTFTALIVLPNEEGELSPWRIVEATEDFVGLEGNGDFSVDEDDDDESGVETITGDVSY